MISIIGCVFPSFSGICRVRPKRSATGSGSEASLAAFLRPAQRPTRSRVFPSAGSTESASGACGHDCSSSGATSGLSPHKHTCATGRIKKGVAFAAPSFLSERDYPVMKRLTFPRRPSDRRCGRRPGSREWRRNPDGRRRGPYRSLHRPHTDAESACRCERRERGSRCR